MTQLVLDGLDGLPDGLRGLRFPTWGGEYEVVERHGAWDTILVVPDAGEPYEMQQTAWRTSAELARLKDRS